MWGSVTPGEEAETSHESRVTNIILKETSLLIVIYKSVNFRNNAK